MKIRDHFNQETKIVTAQTYCKICRNENDVISFKDQCICEACVAYIKGNC
ncbi:hypothetical protein [Fusibacter bizertensis]